MRTHAGPPFRVLVVDDQEIVRESLALLLAQESTVEVVGSLGDGQAAVDNLATLSPDVVVMDIKMPGIDGVEAALLIRRSRPDVGIILLSAYEDPAYVRPFLKDDPRGKAYLLKHTLATTAELVRTIHDVAAGRTVLDPIMVNRLTSGGDGLQGSVVAGLTRRELEVLSLMAMAYSNGGIASALYIQPRTVEHHVNSIFAKLGINPDAVRHPRVQAVLAYLDVIGQQARRGNGPSVSAVSSGDTQDLPSASARAGPGARRVDPGAGPALPSARAGPGAS